MAEGQNYTIAKYGCQDTVTKYENMIDGSRFCCGECYAKLKG